MSTTATNMSDYEAIKETIQHYIDGAISGKGDDMKPAFHDDATIFGYVGDDLFAGPIHLLYEWNDNNGPAKDLVPSIAEINVIGTVANARLELTNWTGHRFTDLFNLLKVNGKWLIMNKVFHLTSE